MGSRNTKEASLAGDKKVRRQIEDLGQGGTKGLCLYLCTCMCVCGGKYLPWAIAHLLK